MSVPSACRDRLRTAWWLSGTRMLIGSLPEAVPAYPRGHSLRQPRVTAPSTRRRGNRVPVRLSRDQVLGRGDSSIEAWPPARRCLWLYAHALMVRTDPDGYMTDADEGCVRSCPVPCWMSGCLHALRPSSRLIGLLALPTTQEHRRPVTSDVVANATNSGNWTSGPDGVPRPLAGTKVDLSECDYRRREDVEGGDDGQPVASGHLGLSRSVGSL